MAEAVGNGAIAVACIEVLLELSALYEGFDALAESVVVDQNDVPAT